MKLNRKYIKKLAGKLFLSLAVCSPLLTSCEQEYKFTSDLALYQKLVILPKEGAAKDGTAVVVYSEGDWTIKALDDDSWLRYDRKSGSKPGQFNVFYDENNGHARMCRILVEANSRKDTVCLKQKGIDPVLHISDAAMTILSNVAEIKARMNSNVPKEVLAMSVIYLANSEGVVPEEKWLSNVIYNHEERDLKFNVSENNSGEKRGARICFKFTNVLDQLAADTLTVYQQKPGASFDDYTSLSFDEVRRLSGTPVSGKKYIEGIILSDKNNENLAPFTDIQTTVYLKNPNGNETFILNLKSGNDNCYNLGDRVKISLSRTTITTDRVTNVLTISGLMITNLLYKSDTPEVIEPREVYMKDLTDKDLYTYVKLKDVEFAVPTGTYYNVNPSYAPTHISVYPKLMRDINGDMMYLLTNIDGSKAPYINGVTYQKHLAPKGSGSIAGILVKETIKNYGQNHGKYYLRHLWEKDIELVPERENGFSQVIAEWSHHAVPPMGKKTLTSETGVGELSHSVCDFKDVRLNNNTLDGVNYKDIGYNIDYDGLTMTDWSTLKGDFRCANWWPDNATEGAWWLVQLPTIGINKQMSIQIEGNSYSGKDPVGFPAGQYAGPCNFTLQYSLDLGLTWKTVGDYTMEAQGIWGTYLNTLLPGFKVVNFNLPMECCGQQELQIRLKMKDRNVAFGKFLNNLYNDLGHLSIKCNK